MARPDPTAGFTDMQWYMYRQRNVAFFAAFTRVPLSPADLIATARRLTELAPQLRVGFAGADPAQPISDIVLQRLVSSDTVDALDGFPEVWVDDGGAIFAEPGLPLFRLRYAGRRDGADAAGRCGFVIVQVSHALVEGADSALLTRSQSAAHPPGFRAKPSAPLVKIAASGLGVLLSGVHLLAANLMNPHPGPFRYAARAYPRVAFSQWARELGIRQRALFFALVMETLFDAGTSVRRRISSTYSVIDEGGGADRDAYMRMRMRFASFPIAPGFDAFARAVDFRLLAAESKQSGFNAELNAAGIRIHRMLSRALPFAYTSRLFNFMPYDVVLGLIPPHRLGGELTASLLEPVYAGASLAGANACVIVPGRRQVSFNFYVQNRLLPRLDRLDTLLAPAVRSSVVQERAATS